MSASFPPYRARREPVMSLMPVWLSSQWESGERERKRERMRERQQNTHTHTLSPAAKRLHTHTHTVHTPTGYIVHLAAKPCLSAIWAMNRSFSTNPMKQIGRASCRERV